MKLEIASRLPKFSKIAHATRMCSHVKSPGSKFILGQRVTHNQSDADGAAAHGRTTSHAGAWIRVNQSHAARQLKLKSSVCASFTGFEILAVTMCAHFANLLSSQAVSVDPEGAVRSCRFAAANTNILQSHLSSTSHPRHCCL